MIREFRRSIPMNRFQNETMVVNRPSPVNDRPSDSLAPDLMRIVRRALRHPNDCSPLARAVQAAAAQIDPGPYASPLDAEELRVRKWRAACPPCSPPITGTPQAPRPGLKPYVPDDVCR